MPGFEPGNGEIKIVNRNKFPKGHFHFEVPLPALRDQWLSRNVETQPNSGVKFIVSELGLQLPRSKYKQSALSKSVKKTLTRTFADYLPTPSKNYVLDYQAGHLCARELLADIAARRCSDSESQIGAMVFVMIEHRFHKKGGRCDRRLYGGD